MFAQNRDAAIRMQPEQQDNQIDSASLWKSEQFGHIGS